MINFNLTTNEFATRCLNAAADLDDDESASPTELAAIAAIIANRLLDDDSPIPPYINEIARLTQTRQLDILTTMRSMLND
jgi:hypothetical protein